MKIVAFIALCIVWGTTWVAMKISLEGFPPFLGAGLRFLTASVVLALIVKQRGITVKVSRNDFKILIIAASLMYGLDYGLIYWGAQFLSAGVTSVFFATFPLFTAIWTIAFFKDEKFDPVRMIGIAIGFIGITIVFYDQLAAADFSDNVIWPVLAVMGGAAAGALSISIVKKYIPTMSALPMTFHQILYGTLQLLLLSIIFEKYDAVKINGEIIGATVYLGVVGSALAFMVYYKLLQSLSAITLLLIIYITPIVALISDYLWYGNEINIRIVLGIMTVFTGIFFTQLNAFKTIWRKI